MMEEDLIYIKYKVQILNCIGRIFEIVIQF